MDKKELEQSLNSDEKFVFPDYREESREDMIRLINELMNQTSSLVFSQIV